MGDNDDDRAKFNDFLRDLETRTKDVLLEDEFIQQRRNLQMMQQQRFFPSGPFGLQRMPQHLPQQQFPMIQPPDPRLNDPLVVQTQFPQFRPSAMPNSVLEAQLNFNHQNHLMLNRRPQARPTATNVTQIRHQQPPATLPIQNNIARHPTTANFQAPPVMDHYIYRKKEPKQFPRLLFEVLNGKISTALKWSTDGRAIVADDMSRFFGVLTQNVFRLENEQAWQRELKNYGFQKQTEGKYSGFIYHPQFHKKMTEVDFLAILKKKEEKEKVTIAKNTEETIRRALAHPLLQQNPFLQTKESKAAAKAGMANEEKETNAMKRKFVPTTAATKRKVAPDAVSQASRLKKSKRTETPTTPERLQKKHKPTTSSPEPSKKQQKEATTSPKPSRQEKLSSKIVDSKNDKKEIRALKRRLREHKRLHKMLWKWDLWNFPKHLDEVLKTRKRLQEKRFKWYFRDNPLLEKPPDEDPEAHLVKNMSGDISDLLCDEELPECLSNGEQDLAEFVERIRKDKLEQDKLDEIWSNMLIPVVNGKDLPASKFAKPNETWKQAKDGDKIEIFCRETGLCNKATIRKQRQKSSYFHLIYDDGAEEWLDLSREKIKILSDTDTAIAENLTTGKDDGEQSSQEDGGAIGSIQLPENYSHLAPFVRYSWKRLGLGSRVGTPSYNEYVKERDPSAPEATVLEILNDVRALRATGFSGVSLELDDENPIEDESGNSSESEKRYKEQLCSIQDRIEKEKDATSSMREFDKVLASVRKLTDSWSVRTVQKNLRTIDTQISKLNEREAVILEKCKQRGLI